MKLKDSANAVRLYTLLQAAGNQSTLIGPDHSDVNDDKVIITQKAPTPQKLYPGARKSNLAYIMGAISTEGGIPVRRPLRVDISTSHTAGYTDAQVKEAVLRAVSAYVDQEQLLNIVFKGVRPS